MRTNLKCMHCGNLTAHTLLFEHEFAARYVDAEGFCMTEPATYSALTCETCTELSLYISSNIHGRENQFGELTYPGSSSPFDGLPKAVASALREAEKVRQVSKAAFVLMGRRALEEIAKDQGVWRHNLAASISVLAEIRHLPPALADAATLIRLFGNESAHGSAAEFNEHHIEMIDHFLNVLVGHLYWLPRSLATFVAILDVESMMPNRRLPPTPNGAAECNR